MLMRSPLAWDRRAPPGFIRRCRAVLPSSTRSGWRASTSRLLKNSFAFADEAGVIAVVDEDVPDEPPGGA